MGTKSRAEVSQPKDCCVQSITRGTGFPRGPAFISRSDGGWGGRLSPDALLRAIRMKLEAGMPLPPSPLPPSHPPVNSVPDPSPAEGTAGGYSIITPP